MKFDLVIRNGKIVSSQGTYEGDDIAVKDGKTVAIDRQGSFPDAKRFIDADGLNMCCRELSTPMSISGSRAMNTRKISEPVRPRRPAAG